MSYLIYPLFHNIKHSVETYLEKSISHLLDPIGIAFFFRLRWTLPGKSHVKASDEPRQSTGGGTLETQCASNRKQRATGGETFKVVPPQL